jgi:hypothetical protein
LFSPKLAIFRGSDATIIGYHVRSSDQNSIFPRVLGLGRGNVIELAIALAGLLADLSEEFGSSDFGELCDSYFPTEFTVNIACDLLCRKFWCSVDFTQAIGYLAANVPKCCQSINDSKLPAPLLSDVSTSITDIDHRRLAVWCCAFADLD